MKKCCFSEQCNISRRNTYTYMNFHIIRPNIFGAWYVHGSIISKGYGLIIQILQKYALFVVTGKVVIALEWRHNEHNSVSKHRRLGYLLNSLFRRRSKKTSKLRVTVLCAGNPLVTGEFPAKRASNGENISIWWRHHGEDHCNDVIMAR